LAEITLEYSTQNIFTLLCYGLEISPKKRRVDNLSHAPQIEEKVPQFEDYKDYKK